MNKEELKQYIVDYLDDPNNNIDDVMEKIEEVYTRESKIYFSLIINDIWRELSDIIWPSEKDKLLFSWPKDFVIGKLKETFNK